MSAPSQTTPSDPTGLVPREDPLGWAMIVAVIAFYVLATTPLGVWILHHVASTTIHPDTITIVALVAGMTSIPILAALGFWRQAHKNPIMAMVIFVGCLPVTLYSTSHFLNSDEMQALRALHRAQVTVDQATQIRGAAPAIASSVQSIQDLDAAIANKDLLQELAQASADSQTVIQTLGAIQVLQDNSAHARFVKENSMVRAQDQEYFAKAFVQHAGLQVD